MALKNEVCSERRICLGSVHHRTVWDFYPLWKSSRVSFLPLLWAFCSLPLEFAVYLQLPATDFFLATTVGLRNKMGFGRK